MWCVRIPRSAKAAVCAATGVVGDQIGVGEVFALVEVAQIASAGRHGCLAEWSVRCYAVGHESVEPHEMAVLDEEVQRGLVPGIGVGVVTGPDQAQAAVEPAA